MFTKSFLFVFSFLALLQNLSAFELKRVILATNNNDQYIQFWPVVAPLWKEMGLQPTLALIGDKNCTVDESLGDVIRFAPIPGVSEALQAQTIRLLLPILFPNDGCIISDIDMLPVNRDYFFDGAKKCPDNGFLVYRDRAVNDPNKITMCYVAALGKVFGSVFGVSRKEQIAEKILAWSKLGFGWPTDELMLYDAVTKWEKQNNLVVRLGHGVGARLDRGYWDEAYSDSLDMSPFIDAHCPRPYCINTQTIDRVCKAIRKSWKELKMQKRAKNLQDQMKNQMKKVKKKVNRIKRGMKK